MTLPTMDLQTRGCRYCCSCRLILPPILPPIDHASTFFANSKSAAQLPNRTSLTHRLPPPCTQIAHPASDGLDDIKTYLEQATGVTSWPYKQHIDKEQLCSWSDLTTEQLIAEEGSHGKSRVINVLSKRAMGRRVVHEGSSTLSSIQLNEKTSIYYTRPRTLALIVHPHATFTTRGEPDQNQRAADKELEG